jgi:hypothetical protein
MDTLLGGGLEHSKCGKYYSLWYCNVGNEFLGATELQSVPFLCALKVYIYALKSQKYFL